MQLLKLSLLIALLSSPLLNSQNASFDGISELPKRIVQTTGVVSTGKIVTVNRGDDLQSKLNSLNCGDTAVLQAGSTWSGNFRLPFRPCNDQQWITIQSSGLTKLPPSGNRVSPADSGNMPRILTTNSHPAIDTALGPDGQDLPANHYRISGLEIGAIWDTRKPPRGSDPEIYIVANFGSGGTVAAKYPHHFVIDRCYIHGAKTNDVRHGVRFTAAYFAVVDSYISDIHESGRDSTAISSDFSPGPIKIVNNYLEAAGENILFGGTDPQVRGFVPSDIEVRQNYFFKQLSWKQGAPNYLGIRWTLKNLFECKNCQRVLLEGNVFENQWAGDQANAIVLTPRNANGNCDWCTVADVTFRFNRVTHAAGFMSILGADAKSAGGSMGPSQPAQRIHVHDNVIEDINYKEWGGGDYSNGRLITIVMGTGSPKIDKLTFAHNTFAGNANACSALITLATNSKSVTMTNLVIRDNIFPACKYSISGDYGMDRAAITAVAPGSYTFTDNVFVGWEATGMSGDLFIPKNFKIADYTALRFQNYNAGVGGDYHLSARSSFRNKGSDSKDIGANIDLVSKYTLPAISGKSPSTSASIAQPETEVPRVKAADGAIQAKTGIDELGNAFIQVMAPRQFALRLSDGTHAVSGPTSTGLTGFWDLKNDPEMKFNLAGVDAGMLSKDFGFEGMFEAKPSGGHIRLIEQNDVRVVVEFSWPVRAFGKNTFPLNSALRGNEIWTIYKPGKIYERFSFSNSTKTDIPLQYFQYCLHTSWTDFDGEARSYESPYWQTLGGYTPRTPSPWGFVGDSKSPATWMLHSPSKGTTTAGSASYGVVKTVQGQNVPIRASFLEVLGEGGGNFAYSGQLFVGLRSKMQISATIPPGQDSWTRHLLVVAGDNGILDESRASKLAAEYRNPPILKTLPPVEAHFNHENGCYEIIGATGKVDFTTEGSLYFPCFDLRPWNNVVPQSVALTGASTGESKFLSSGLDGHLLLQLQQEVSRGTRIIVQ